MQKMKIYKTTILIFMTVIVLVGVFLLSIIAKMNALDKIEAPLAFDPYTFLPRSQAFLETGKIYNYNPYLLTSNHDAIQPLFQIIIALIVRTSRITLIDVYNYFGVVITSITSILFFFFAKRFMRLGGALIATMLFSASPYFLSRGLLSVPESLAFFFHVTILFSLVWFIEQRRIFIIPFFVLPLIVLYFTHSSFFLMFFIVFLLGVIFLFINRDSISSLKKVTILLLVPIIFFIVIKLFFENIYNQFIFYAIHNFKFSAPDYRFFINNIGQILVILGGIGFSGYLFRSFPMRHGYKIFLGVLFCVCIGYTFFVGPEFKMRIIFYFAMPVAIFAGISYQWILDLHRSALTKSILVALLILVIVPFTPSYIYESFHSRDEISVAIWLKHNTPETALSITPSISADIISTFLTRRMGTKSDNMPFIANKEDLQSYLAQLHIQYQSLYLAGSIRPYQTAIAKGYSEEKAKQYAAAVSSSTVDRLSGYSFLQLVYRQGDAFVFQYNP